MASLPWVDVRRYSDGQSIDAATLNIPVEDLVSRTDYLKSLLDGFGDPFASVIISNLTYDESEVSIGDVVYIDADTSYSANPINVHLAKSVVDAMDALASYKSSFAIGIVSSIQTTTKCSVTIYGQVKNLGIANLTDDQSDTPGVYYLSGRTAGKITMYPSGPQVLIGTFLKDRCFLTPNHKSFAESHIHRSVKLSTQILTGSDITSDSTEGWVAEDGGGYKYKMAKGSMLDKFYPPIPRQCASLVINGVELQSKNIDPQGGVYLIDDDTIHMDKNWFESSNSQIDKITFHFIRGIQGNQGPVTSLRPKEGSPIKITECGTTTPAVVGDLEIDVDLNIEDEDANEPGFFVYKKWDTNKHKFKKGPVVERVVAGNGIEISYENSKYPGQGSVTIGVADSNTSGEFDTTALQNAKQEMLGLFPYIKLPSYVEAVPYAFVVKFQVPVNLPNKEYNIRFYASMFGSADLTYNAQLPLGFQYNILPDLYSNDHEHPSTNPTNNLRTGLIDSGEKTISVPLYNGYTAYDPVLITNDPTMPSSAAGTNRIVNIEDLFALPESTELATVRPGYVVAVRLSRAYSDGTNIMYSYPVGFINLRWAITPITTEE